MSRRALLFPGLLLGLTVLLIGGAALPEEDDDDDEGLRIAVPEDVLEAAEEAVDDIEIEEASAEAVLIYELTGTAGGKTHEIEVTAEGKVLAVEEEGAEEDDDAKPAARDDDDRPGAAKSADDSDADGEQAGEEKEAEEKEAEGQDEQDEGDAEHELTVPLTALPPAVLDAARKAVEGIELQEAEVESVLVYELEGEVGEKEYELEVTAEGQVLEVETGEEDE
jgi:hypothetical protein